MALYRGAGGAGDATNDATSQAILAAESAQQAAASEAAAASSASSAATSASNAASSATSAASSATSASNSASSAATQAANAASSEATATTKASQAATSATNAASSATSAATSATNASNSATAAANSATSASNSASAASTSATNAATYASNAATSATNAAASETNAAASANSASTSATSAATSATSAGNSASSATTSATNAASSASAAATSASNAATSATSASNSATSASTSATNAANSASSASTSATNAASSATAAAASYDSFDDRYLGSKTSNPTLDNDGNAILTGALYWNSTVGEMRVYNGSAWVAAYVPTATYVAKAGDVMTGSLEVPTQASLKATTLTRASIRPSLLLDFANTKQLDPRITFSRPTTATYYDGKTTAVAEQNLLTYSQDFTQSAWTKQPVTVVANSTTAPDGTTTASTLTADGTSNWHGIFQNITSGSTTSKVFSVYAKAGTNNFVQLMAGTDAQMYANFDLSLGTVGTVGSNATAAITSIGNGWYRCQVTTTSSTATYFGVVLITTSTAARAETNTLTTNVYLWGAQYEQRSTVTAYTPTTTAQITNYIPVLKTAVSNDARFDHDPVTGESKGLLIEEQRTNLLTYSDQFDNAVWSNSNLIVSANTVVAPDGTLTGDKLTEDATTNFHYVTRPIAASGIYTFSVFAKAGEKTTLAISFDGFGNLGGAVFNLSNGTVVVTTGLRVASGSIFSTGNGWYRCIVTSPSLSGTRYPIIALGDGTSYLGNGYSGLYIWGAQVEAGSFPTSYIPTQASQVTRSADSASMTGSNFSSWYRADEGTLYGESSCYSNTVNTISACLNSGGTLDESYMKFSSSSTLQDYYIVGANAQFSANLSGVTTAPNTFYKQTLGYKTNDFAGNVNGGAVATDTSGSLALFTQLNIGSRGNATQVLNGTIKRIAYYPKRLSNVELQGLTS